MLSLLKEPFKTKIICLGVFVQKKVSLSRKVNNIHAIDNNWHILYR